MGSGLDTREAKVTINAVQVREACKLLGWTVSVLAKKSGVEARHIDGFEQGSRRMSVLNLSVMQRVLENAGIEFTNERQPEVRMKATKPSISDEAAIPDIPDDAGPYDEV